MTSSHLAAKIQIFVSLVIVLLANDSMAQSNVETHKYNLLSLEDGQTSITVVSDGIAGKITIESPGCESICVPNFKGMVHPPSVLGEKFLAINFQVKAGTKTRAEDYVLVCVSSGEICIAFNVSSSMHGEISEWFDKRADSLGYYDEIITEFVPLELLHQDGTCMLLGTEKHYEKSNMPNVKNVDSRDTIRLSFDPQEKVFYQTWKELKGTYKVFALDENRGWIQTKKTFAVAKYMTFRLYGDEYYFIENKWFLKSNRQSSSELFQVRAGCY